MSTPDTYVLIGRFQPFHQGHLALLLKALALGPVVVVLGSSFGARSPKNPFTWEERASMIKLSLPEQYLGQVKFAAVRDFYDDKAWVSSVKTEVHKLVGAETRPTIVGYEKDATSYYLTRFEGWGFKDLGSQGELSATPLRHALLSGAPYRATREVLSAFLPVPVLDYLQGWAQLPYLKSLSAEWQAIQGERALWAGSPYKPVFVTADALVTCQDRVLLVQRKGPLGAGLWAMPGGFLDQEERVLQTALRELKEETLIGLREEDIERTLKGRQFFDHPQRSLRGRTITFVHHFDLGDIRLPHVEPSDDAAAVDWVRKDDLAEYEPRLFEDHFVAMNHFLDLIPK